MNVTEYVADTPLGKVSFGSMGSGPDLVLLHSLLSDRNVFYRVVPALVERHRVHLVDLPGFGVTDLQPPTMDAYGDLIAAWMEAIGIGPDATVLGNGLGGFVAIATAVRHGERFTKLIVVGAGAGFPEDAKGAFATMAARAGEFGMAGVVDIAVRRVFPPAYLAAHPEEYAEREAVLLRTNVAALQRACRALQTVDYFESAASISNPTLIVVGSEDAATPPALARRLHGLIPNSSYVELSGVAHGPQLQDPDGFLAALDPFLAS